MTSGEKETVKEWFLDLNDFNKKNILKIVKKLKKAFKFEGITEQLEEYAKKKEI